MTTCQERYIVKPATDRPGYLVIDTKDGSPYAARPTLDAAQALADDKNARAS